MSGADLPLFRVIQQKLQRRQLGRVAVLYVVTAYILLEIFDVFFHLLELPHWVGRAVVALAVLGFPLVLLFAWTFEDIGSPTDPSPGHGIRRARLNRAILVAVVLALAAFAVMRLRPGTGAESNGGELPAPATVVRPSIAVMPFVDLSEQHDQGYFSDGLAEELINLLTHIEGLRVVARASSFSFRERPAELMEIAQRLNVSSILTGSVRKAGNRLRVTTQLVQPSTGEALWSQSYDRDLNDVFRVQDEIAAAVVAALQVRLGAGTSFAGLHGTRNPDAYAELLMCRKGSELAHDTADLRQAVAHCESAIRQDQGFADAYAELAVATVVLGDLEGHRRAVPRAMSLADQAVELGPDRATAYSARAFLRSQFLFEFGKALTDSQRAVEVAPDDSVVLQRHAALLITLGRYSEARVAMRRLVTTDPLEARAWVLLGRAHQLLGEDQQAQSAFRHALELAPDSSVVVDANATIELVQGHPEKALELFRKLPHQDPWHFSGIAACEFTLGKEEESRKSLAHLKQFASQGSAYQIAEVHAWRGETDEAFHWFERAWRQRDAGLAALKWDPYLGSLRNDQRYAKLLARVGIPN